MTDQISAFIDHLRGLGIGPHDPSEIIADDKKRRYRLQDDKPKTRNASYQLRIEHDGFAVGWARSYKEGVTHSWHSKATRKATPEEKAEWKAKADAARKAQSEEQARIAALSADKAAKIWAQAATTGATEYTARKQVTDLHGARIWRDMVVVPMRIGGKITGLQFISADGTKRFLTGSAKDGAYHAMARQGEPLSRILIAEGYATAVALRDALALPVIVAFDAGNLKAVAKAIRSKNKDAEIIIAGDNDQWTTRQDGTPWNPGLDAAQQAALAIGGARVIVPEFSADDPDRPTDWDDVARIEGHDAIRDAFNRIPEPEPEPMPDYDMRDVEPDMPDDPLDAIRPLGHNRGVYYFFPRAAGQIVSLSASAMGRVQNLYLLAPRGFWERHYSPDGKTPDSQICAFASGHLMDACHKRGIFQQENTRGVGAWVDGKLSLINCGDVVVTSDGRRCHPAEFNGEYVYESGHRSINLDVEPATNKEAAKLLDLCKSLKVKRPQYATLMAGWCVIAPMSGALKWCPHIWLTGPAGSGKSWVLNHIIVPAIGRIGIKRDGGTSEAGIRKAIGISARPYMLDEAESQNNQRQMETEKILALLRGASSGSVVENAYATYQVKSCFALAAIIPRIEQVADKERITLIELLKPHGAKDDAAFEILEDQAEALLTQEYSDALLARTIANMDTLLKNVRVFSKAASREFGNKRSGEQIGAMLAGAYLLTTTKEITLDQAREWIAKQNWDWHTESYTDSDAGKLITYILTHRVHYDHEGMGRQATIGDLIQHAHEGSINSASADKALRSYGLRVVDNELMVSNTAPNLRRILKDTQYIPWQRTLADYPGAHNNGNKPVHFMTGFAGKVTALPLAALLGSDVEEEELPLDNGGDWE